MGRPQFVNGVQDFTNAAKNRKMRVGGAGEGADGALGAGQGAGGAPSKGGLIDPKGQIVNTNDTIPYNAKDVREISLITFIQSFCFICKESFDVGFDEEEESYFFIHAKKIKLNQD